MCQRILINKHRGPFSGSKRGYDGMSNKSVHHEAKTLCIEPLIHQCTWKS